MVESINGHMTRYWRHVTKRKGNRESWNFMEGHGNLREKGNVYIYYLVANQASNFLASDFCVLVCYILSSLLQVYQQAGILENSAIIYLILLLLYFSASFWLLAYHHLPLRPSQGEI